MMLRIAHTAWRFTPLLILALFWEAIARLGLVSEYALPSFTAVVAAFIELADTDLWTHTVLSLSRGGTALGLAIVFGVTVGVGMAWYRPVRIFINPVMQCLYPMPKSALIPLTIMWIGLGDASKITLIFIGCLLPIVISSFNAARGTDEVLLWSARSLGATEQEVLRQVVLPAALPEILNGIRTALALAFILMVAGELIISNNGVGYLIDVLGEGGSYAAMFSVVITISAVGFFADRLLVAVTRRILIWREAQS
ncbi:MAG: ABC transporter permease [Rhodospirillaceae bacterium]